MNNNDRHRENFNNRFSNTGLNEMQINMKYQALLREQEMCFIGAGTSDSTFNSYAENDYVEDYLE